MNSMAEGRLFNVKRLVALDMSLHGSVFILAEFTFGVVFPLVLGSSLITQGYSLFGLYIFVLGFNYVPVLLYALALRNSYAHVVDMKDPDTRRLNRKYSIQQFLIFIPFFMVALAVAQRLQRH